MSAKRYWTFSKTYSLWVTQCPTDWDEWDPTCVQIDWSPQIWTIESSCPKWPKGVPPTWTMTCMMWDSTPPSWMVLYSTPQNKRTNQDVTVTIICLDSWWSWCSSSNSTFSKTVSSNESWWTYFIDNAWNIGYVSYSVQNIDKIVPTLNDVINNNLDNLLANDEYEYTISIDDALGSPIASVEWTMENKNDEWTTSFIDKVSPWSQTWDISDVDSFRTEDSNSARQMTFTLTKICDQAWNCWSWSEDYNHNVYANSLHIWTKSIDSTHLDNITNWTSIADGLAKSFDITLKDVYWNNIIPAPWINRTIDFNFDVSNTTYLDQYKKTGDAVFLTIPSEPYTYANRLINNYSFDSQPSSTWVYPFSFKVYTPTQNVYDKANWNFTINSITYDINDSTFGNVTNQTVNNSNIAFKFKPLYYTTFNWEQRNYGFVEWATQTWTIVVSKDSSWDESWVSLRNLYLEFGSWLTNQISPNFDLQANLQSWTSYIWEGNNNLEESKLFKNLFISDTYNLQTLLTQTWWTVDSLTKQYLSTHISYTLDWKNVVYNSDIIWKDSYWWSPLSINTMQSWLKVIWSTHSQSQNDLTTNQNETDIHILWNITKSSLKRDIRKSAYDIIKNINHDSWSSYTITNLTWSSWFNNTWWKKLLNDKIIYYNLTWDQAWKNVELTWNEVWWNKTIIIKWWNLYIKSDLSYDSSTDTLWIIVLKDDNNNWWNLYIDPNVKNVVWSIYVDKSIMSYNTIYCNPDWEISPNCGWTLEALKNQLYIYWQVFSENTIGWSRSNPLICPYYKYNEPSFICDLDTAQKYDLNYLRRYFVYDNNNDCGWVSDWLINSCDDPYGWYWNSNYFDRNSIYYLYPIIIEYNPMIQVSPPPLFNN